MASSREHQGTARKKNLPYLQSVDYDEYEEEENENFERTHNRNALFNNEYTEGEGEYEEYEYREGNYEENENAEQNIDPDSPTSPSNGHPFPSPPPSPPTDDGYDEDNNSNAANKFTSVIPPPPPARAKKLPSIPQTLHVDDKTNSQNSQMPFRPSAPTPSHQKRKINYFAIGNLTSRLKFKKSHAKEEEPRNIDPPLPEPPQRIQITLPSLAPSSPISHQLPAEYLEFEEEIDNHSEVQTTPELTMDDLYHVVLNMQKGFQLQVDEMNAQIKELKREVRRLKGEESEEEEEETNANELEDFRSPSRTATSVRSVAKEMERYGGEGRWFHNEYS